MISKKQKDRGLFARLIEKAIEIFLKKECKSIDNIYINIFASSSQIIKGLINSVHIKAEDIEYKQLYIDSVELESNKVEIRYKIKNKSLIFNNNLSIEFKLHLSKKSLNKILSSESWSWVGERISTELLNLSKFNCIDIKNNKIEIEAQDEKNSLNKKEIINIQLKDGKIYLESELNSSSTTIPIEEKIIISELMLKDNFIIISATSLVNFN